MPHRQQNASSSSRRNDSHNPNVQASGDQLQSKDDDMTNYMLSPGVKLLPDLGRRSDETCNMVYFRTTPDVGTIPNEPVVREYSCSNTKDILNILTGSLSENEHDGESVIFGTKKMFRRMPGQMVNGKIIYCSRSRLGASSLQKVHIFSDCLLHRPRRVESNQCFKQIQNRNQNQ